MKNPKSVENQAFVYTVDEWGDVEHCVYHGLIDGKEKSTLHRISHFISRLTATMVANGSMTEAQVEEFIASCRA